MFVGKLQTSSDLLLTGPILRSSSGENSTSFGPWRVVFLAVLSPKSMDTEVAERDLALAKDIRMAEAVGLGRQSCEPTFEDVNIEADAAQQG